MKTNHEKHFEYVVIKKICKEMSNLEHQVENILRFHCNCDNYYDNLCDSIFAISTGQIVKPLWFTPYGDSYLSYEARSKADRVLLFPNEVPSFKVDLVEQLELALQKI